MIKISNNIQRMLAKQADWGSPHMNIANILPTAMMHGIQR